jgi:hypothetical protein
MIKIQRLVVVIFLLFNCEYTFSQNDGGFSKLAERQDKSYWKKKKAEEKAHKKMVREHWKKIGDEKYVGSGQKVYKHMNKTKKTSTRLNNKKHRNPLMRKNKRVNRDPFFKRMLYKLSNKKKKE